MSLRCKADDLEERLDHIDTKLRRVLHKLGEIQDVQADQDGKLDALVADAALAQEKLDAILVGIDAILAQPAPPIDPAERLHLRKLFHPVRKVE